MKMTAAACVSFAFLAGAAWAEDVVFTVNNNTSVDVTEFYTSPKGVDNWEEDVTGSQDILAGETAEVTISDGRDACEYDLRFVFADGNEVVDTQDICDMSSYDLTE